MIPLQLSFAIVQATAAVLSNVIWIATKPKTGKVSLPIFANEPLSSPPSSQEVVEELAGEEKADPFDVSSPMDFVDGTPIDEDAFWARMRVRKTLQTIIAAILVSFDTFALAWLTSAKELPQYDLAVAGLQLLSSTYIFIISIKTIRLSDVPQHWNATVHLCTLSTIGASLFAVRLLLPTTQRPSRLEVAFDFFSLVFYVVLTILSSTTRRCPPVHFPPERMYHHKILETSAPTAHNNVCDIVGGHIISFLMFSYTTPIVMLGYTSESVEIKDLPIVPSNMRAARIFSEMRSIYKNVKVKALGWRGWRETKPKSGSGWDLMYKIVYGSAPYFAVQMTLAATTAVLYYAPAYFLKELIQFLEVRNGGRDPSVPATDRSWGWVYCAGLFFSNAINYIITGQMWSISTTSLQVRIRTQLITLLFAKTLVRKDIAGSAAPSSSSSTEATNTPAATTPATTNPSSPNTVSPAHAHTPLPTEDDGSTTLAASTSIASTKDGASAQDTKSDEDDFSSKAQILTLMTTDADRVGDFSWHFFSCVDAPIEIVIGAIFLYHLLGVSSLLGLGVTCLFLPINHYASKVVVAAQDSLMKSRDERVALMNEILGGIRMLKFMAWERSFEKRVLQIRKKELGFQKRNFYIETLFSAVWNASPVLVTLVSFWHFAVIRKQPLTPSVAFTSLSVFNELKFALNALPETFINVLQSLVSVRRIENYLHGQEVNPVQPLEEQANLEVAINSATISWPIKSRLSDSRAPSTAPTPKYKFALRDIDLHFPKGEVSLICGKLGSGKTLMLLSLLGEADVLAGQIICPRSPPDSLARFSKLSYIPEDEWVVPGVCAYVPQTAWLQNASIKQNILFGLPYDETRYTATLEACALVADLHILEDGDEAEIGERGVNLSGGQKARVSLARALYSRASLLLLDDVLSAVDAHTAQHLFEHAIHGPLMQGRTVILVSHHVQLCTPGAKYIVALNNGKLLYAGDRDGFKASGVMAGLVQSTDLEVPKEDEKPEPSKAIVDQTLLPPRSSEPSSSSASGEASSSTATPKPPNKKPRKLIEDEKRAVGRISRKVWETYAKAVGGWFYWIGFITILLLSAASPVFENGWLKYWAAKYDHEEGKEPEMKSPMFYLAVYGAVTGAGVVIQTIRFLTLYEGAIHASTVLYQRLLKAVLFAHIRFHDTTNRGRLLNRFGKDFEGIDSNLADNLGNTVTYFLAVVTTFLTVSWVGGVRFLLAALVLGVFYFEVGRVYGQISRDVRRLDSVTRSPLYTIYGESISGVGVLRAFGASTKVLKEMLQHADANINPYYWMWSVNRWLSARFNLLSSAVVGVTGVVILLNDDIDAATAGFALAFAGTVTNNLLFMVRRFVGLEQSMVALERIQEFSEIAQEPPEFIEPRPPASWPHEGSIDVENLVIRYAPDLPNVLHGITFSVKPGEKIGVLGRTGGGKSTLALSFFRFVEATEGKIVVDGVNIADIGLTDLRSKLTIIPQDPTILSGTLRSTLDVFDEYTDHEIFEALRRVHLIPSTEEEVSTAAEQAPGTNANVFRNLDSPVSEGGENFSAGEKQLICMARAILKRSKVLFMDEATASVDYATDELIGQTIRQEFASSTILTIAHRLRTVIDYDKILLLDRGRIAEFDKPSVLLANTNSMFYALCKSAGKAEFEVLKRMASGATEGYSV